MVGGILIIGVASVIVMVSVASGAGQAIEARIKSLGTNLLVISPGSSSSGGRRSGEGTAIQLKEADLAVLRERVPGVVAASGVVQGSAPIIFGNNNWTTSVDGVNADYLEIRDWQLVEGRNFTDQELRSAAKVVILGSTAARELFGDDPVIGQQVRIMNVPFTVVGLLSAKGQTGFGQDQDDTAFIPLTTAKKRVLGGRWVKSNLVGSITVKVREADNVAVEAEEVVGAIAVDVEDDGGDIHAAPSTVVASGLYSMSWM